MIRAKRSKGNIYRSRKASIIDKMAFMHVELLIHDLPNQEIQSQDQYQQTIFNRTQLTELNKLVQNATITTTSVVFCGKDEILEKTQNAPLPSFFQMVQTKCKAQIKEAQSKRKQERIMQNFLLHQNQPFRETYHQEIH